MTLFTKTTLVSCLMLSSLISLDSAAAQSWRNGWGNARRTTYDVRLYVLLFAQNNLGRQVGNGQCSSLVASALAAAGARPGDFSRTPYAWGRLLASGEVMYPGDIIQFQDCRFQNGGSWIDLPQHTAIIKSARGTELTVLHQNFNGNTTVTELRLDLAWKTRGSYYVYRPLRR